MARTIVDIPNAQLVEIDRLCNLLGISRAEAVRRALRVFAEGHAEVTSEAFGLWKPSKPSATDVPGSPEACRR